MYVDEGRFAEAVVEYRLAVQGAPRRSDLRMKLAETYIRNGNYAEAVGEAARASDLQPGDVDLHVKVGNILLMAHGFDDARMHAERALALAPDNLDATLLLGNAEAGLKSFDDAIRDYQDAILLKPAEGQPYVNLASILQIQGKRREAEETFRKAVAVAPKNPIVHLALANFLWTTGQVDEAERSLKAALAIDAADLAANRAMVVLCLSTHRAAEAEPYISKLTELADTTRANLTLADYYVSLKRPEDARNVLTGILSRKDAYVPASVRLSAIDDSEGLRAPALARLRDVLEKFPKDTSARVLRAKILRDDGKVDEALAEATSVARDDPGSPQAGIAFMLIGRIAAETERYEEAIAAYEEVLKRDARSVPAALALAALNLGAGSLNKAAGYVAQVLTADPGNLSGRVLRVRVLMAQNNRADAAAALASLVHDVPNSTAVLNLVAAEQLATGQVDGARATYLKVVKMSPDNVEAAAGLVRLDLARGNTKDAVARVEAHINDGANGDAPSADFLRLAAKTYDAVGDLSKEEAALRRAVEVAPDRMGGYSALGMWYARRNHLDEARAKFEELVRRNPKSVWAGTMLGMVLESLGKSTEAEKRYQAVLAINANAAVAANNLAYRYLLTNRDLQKALELAQTALQQSPGDPHANDTLGWAYYRHHHIDEALRYLQASVKIDSTNPVAHYHLGMAYAASGDADAAIKSLRRALTARDFANRDEAMKALAEFNGTSGK
jgi:tetratricopeptide (TPR) repeat protein